MAVMDEFKEERAKLKEQSFKKKLSYFWTYYKWYVIVGIIVVIAAGYTIKVIATHTDDALYGIALNGSLKGDEDTLSQSFMEYAGIDPKEYSVSFNTTLRMSDTMTETGVEASQFIMVYSAAKDLDVGIMDAPRFEKYAYGSLYCSLETCLSSEMLDKLAGKVYYVDYTVLEEIEKREDNGESTEDIVRPDPFKPEEMDNPIPVGVDISDCSKFTDAYYYEEGPVYLGIVITSERRETAAKFIEFLFEE
ncbi:MAG: hypothetical protein ACI4TB_09925 [Lachnospiraceae bacterium]